MRERSHSRSHTMYHNPSVRLAADTPRSPKGPPPLRCTVPHDLFHAELVRVARRLRKSVPDLTRNEAQRLADMIDRGEVRYAFVTLRWLLELGWRATDVADRTAFLDALTMLYSTPALHASESLEQLRTLEHRMQFEALAATLAFEHTASEANASALEDAAMRDAAISHRIAQFALAHRAA